MSIWKAKYKYIRFLALLAILGFVTKRVVCEWHSVKFYPLQINYAQLLLSFAGLWTMYILSAILWRQLLSRFDGRISLFKGVAVWLYSQLGKYLPGRGFIYLGRIFLCERYGVSKVNSFVSGVLEFSFQMLSAFIFILIALPIMSDLPNVTYAGWVVFFILVGLVIIHPKCFKWFINKMLSLIKKQAVEIDLTYADMLLYLVLYIFLHMLAGFSFFLFFRAFYNMPLGSSIFISASFIISYTVGILSFLAPAGIGVQEGLLLVFLNNRVPSGVVVQVVLFSRLWTMAADFIAAGLIFILGRRNGN